MKTQKMNKWLVGTGVALIAINTSLIGAENAAVPKKAPLNKEFVAYLSNINDSKLLTKATRATSQFGVKSGVAPAPVSLEQLKQKNQAAMTQTIVKYGTRYDLRYQNKLTPVKDQLADGPCWAFASLASLESCLMPRESWDFSENNLKNTHGFDLTVAQGGNAFMSTAYLTRWSGPAAESADPFTMANTLSPKGLSPVKHVQKVIFTPVRNNATDNNAIKTAIVENGAVYTLMYYDFTADANKKYYNTNTRAYYYDGAVKTSHAVAIVGWDDQYSRANFLKTPAGDGAFIVKNSWGNKWGESGYFYVSYYDTVFARYQNTQFVAAESSANYSTIYQYDPLGWVGTWGFNSETAWMANVFTAAGSSSLSAVGFYTPSLQNSYTVQIYTGVGNIPTSGTLVSTQSGTINTAGYNTIALTKPATLYPGQKFAVVVKLTAVGYNYPLAIESPISGYSSAARASAGQSYISSNGTNWIDFNNANQNSNVCLKAYAK